MQYLDLFYSFTMNEYGLIVSYLRICFTVLYLYGHKNLKVMYTSVIGICEYKHRLYFGTLTRLAR